MTKILTIEASGIAVAGIGIVIEKGFQEGRQQLLAQGYRLESLAIIKSIHDGVLTFT